MNSQWPGLCFDHYERYLGNAAAWERYSLDDTPMQILRYDGLFDGCTALCSIGFAQFSSQLEPNLHEEVVTAVDGEAARAGRLLAMTLFYLGSSIHSVPVLASKGGLQELDPEFVDKYHKSALYFTEPFPFPDGFALCNSPNVTGRFFMAVFIDAKEHEFLKENGAGAFEDELEGANVDPFCLSRPSVV